MKVRYKEDEWTFDGLRILSNENLETIGKTLEDEGPIILEHWFYRGSRSPERFIFDELENFVEYIQSNSQIGDAFYIWSFCFRM